MTLIRHADVDEPHVFNLPASHKDSALQALVGKRLGFGIHREVYELRGRPDVVLKVEITGRTFANVTEWEVWQRVQYAPAIAKWFAPCVEIDQSGHVMIQKRTKPMPDRVWQTLEVPHYFTDLKPDNWGLFRGRPVCHDYALNLLMERGMGGKKLKPAVPAWAKR